MCYNAEHIRENKVIHAGMIRKARQEEFEENYIKDNILAETNLLKTNVSESLHEKYEFSSLKASYNDSDIPIEPADLQENINSRPAPAKKQDEVIKQKKNYAKLSRLITQRRISDNVQMNNPHLLSDKKIRLEEEKLMHGRLKLIDAQKELELSKATTQDQKYQIEMVYSRAAATEAGAKLQKIICGDKYIPAAAYKDKNGRLIGSIQEYIPTLSKTAPVQSPTTGILKVDLFKWQDNPDSESLPTSVTNQILREHVLDWLLCNFDTKGENFLQREDYNLISIDKEAAFKKIFSKESEHMDYNYKPHNNDTIYNVIFKQFVRGKLELEFRSIKEVVDQLDQMSDDEYMAIFQDYIQKRWDLSPLKTKDKLRAKILARKKNLKIEYMNFFGKLINERMENAGKPEFPDAENNIDNYSSMLVDGGQSQFSFG